MESLRAEERAYLTGQFDSGEVYKTEDGTRHPLYAMEILGIGWMKRLQGRREFIRGIVASGSWDEERIGTDTDGERVFTLLEAKKDGEKLIPSHRLGKSEWDEPFWGKMCCSLAKTSFEVNMKFHLSQRVGTTMLTLHQSLGFPGRDSFIKVLVPTSLTTAQSNAPKKPTPAGNQHFSSDSIKQVLAELSSLLKKEERTELGHLQFKGSKSEFELLVYDQAEKRVAFTIKTATVSKKADRLFDKELVVFGRDGQEQQSVTPDHPAHGISRLARS